MDSEFSGQKYLLILHMGLNAEADCHSGEHVTRQMVHFILHRNQREQKGLETSYTLLRHFPRAYSVNESDLLKVSLAIN